MQLKRIQALAGRVLGCACAAVLTLTAGLFPARNAPSAQAAQAVTVQNPIIWADVPDVDIIRVGNTYYTVSTTMYFSPGAPIMKSTDLMSWEICSYVYDTYADGDVQNLKNGQHDYGHGSWAASLRYNKGTFYVFFGSYGSNKSYIYQTKDIENGTWTRSEINGMYHDASMLFDDDGRNYLVYGGGGEIKIKELNAEMTGFQPGGADKTLLKTGLTGLSGEGSHIQKINGWYYVFLIAWPNGSGRIELCYRSKSVLGNYEGKTVLNSGLGTYGSGVAQGGIVDTPDGDWYGLLFQDHGSVGRIPVLVPVTWQDDWPMMGVGGKAPLTLTAKYGYTGTALAKTDEFDYTENKLALEWQWNHNPDNTAWSVTDRPGYLRLTNKSIASHLLNARNTLTQRTEGPACSSYIQLDTRGMKAGDYAGLSAFQFNYGCIGVRVADDGAKKIYMSTNGSNVDVKSSSNKIVDEVNLNGDEIYLKVDFKFSTVDAAGNVSNNIDKANFFYSYDGSSWTKLGLELGMTYDLKLFTGYRSGIYSYATKTTGGYADIDRFDYTRADWNVPVITEPDAEGRYFHNTFESGTDSWVGRGAATVKKSNETPYAGNGALFVSGREESWNGTRLPLSPNVFVPGNTYSFSICAMYPTGAASEEFYLKLEYTDANGDAQYSTIAQATTTAGEYIQLANTAYQIAEDATNMSLYVETAEDTVDFFIDEAVGAVEGTEVDGPKPIDVNKGDINNDGVIDAFDLCLMKQGILEGFSDKLAERAADVDGTGTANINDALQLQEYLLRQVDAFSDLLLPPA